MWGVIYLGSLAFSVFLYIAAQQDSAFTQMLTLPQTQLTDTQQLYSALNRGFLSWEALVSALIVTCFVFLAMLVNAYTKGLVLGVINNPKARVIEVFKRAREYWWPLVKYYTPFTILFLLMLCLSVYAIILVNIYEAKFGLMLVPPNIAYWIVLLGFIFLLLRLLTLFADGVIVGGSQKPLRDSLRFAKAHKKQTLLAAVVLLVAALLVFLINKLLEFIPAESRGTFILVQLIGVLIFFFWRVWVASFAVVLWRRTSQAQRKPRAW
jgi:hypothetical protein